MVYDWVKDIFKTLETWTYYYTYNEIGGYFSRRFRSNNEYSSYLISKSFTDKSI